MQTKKGDAAARSAERDTAGKQENGNGVGGRRSRKRVKGGKDGRGDHGRGEDKKRHKNGLAPPLHPLQILSWVLFPVFIAAYVALTVIPLPSIFKIIACVLYFPIPIFVFVYGAKTTMSDPSDRITINPPENVSDYEHILKYCYVCRANVRPLSMHCRVCDKCVETFDHHCIWLNNCIGSVNYRDFFRTLSLTTLMILAHLAACVATLIAAGIDRSYRDSIQGTLGAALPLWFSLQGISTILLFGVAVMILPLYKFHVQLIRNNTTTYNFLTDKARNIKGKGGGGDRGTVFPEDEMGIGASRMSVCRAMCSIFETAPRQPIGDEAKLDHLMSQADRCPPLPVEEMKETEDTSESLQPPAEEVKAIELKELTV